MKKSEKEALLNAFNIPEPQRKAAFVSEFNEKSKDKKPVILMSRVFRYSSLAAVVALAVGIAAHFSLNSNFSDRFDKDDPAPPAVTTMVTTETPDETTTATAATSQTTVTTTAETSSDNTDKTADTTTKTSSTNTAKTSVTTASSFTTTSTETSRKTTTTTRSSVNTTAPTTTTSTSATEPQTTTTISVPRPTGSKTVTRPIVTTVPPSSNTQPGLTTTGGGAPNVFPDDPDDYTVSCDVYYDTRYMDNVYLMSEIIGNDPVDIPDTPFDELYNRAFLIVSARVENIRSTSVRGMALMQADIRITNTYKGNYYYNEAISVFFDGGYVPAAEYDEYYGLDMVYSQNDYIWDDINLYSSLPELGEEYVFFLQRSIGGNTYPFKSFYPTYWNTFSVFRFENGEYVSLGKDSYRFKLGDLRFR